jgi:hypothetical protein
MKKISLTIVFLMLWAGSAVAQQAAEGKTAEPAPLGPDIFDFRAGAGWYGIRQSGNPIAGEYDYLKSGAAGAFNMEWDPLPQRFVLDSYYLNDKDYFAEADYSYKDIFVLNGYTRSLFHNLNHYVPGPDDAATSTPSFTDLNPSDAYGIENRLSRGFLRLKTPDFPFHLYADTRAIDRSGIVQQRFLSGEELNLVSQSRKIDWDTTEYRVGVNSHLGPVEADYSHTDKKFEVSGEKVLYDTATGASVPHNLVPDLKSASDTVKLHTTYSGKLVLAGTFTDGDKKNEDSGAKVAFTNTAGDVMFMPVTSLIVTVKYRRYDLDVTNPETTSQVNASGVSTVDVRDSISSVRDVVSSTVRYRAADRLTFKAEYITDQTDRDRGALGSTIAVSSGTESNYWVLPESTTKNTARAGFYYRVMNKMTLRGDYSYVKVDNPAYDTDPDTSNNARASLSWMPTQKLSTMLSYGAVREKRDELSAPSGGGRREASRDQGLASATLLIGKRSSLTASYAYYKNKVEQTITLEDGSGAFDLESGVPYSDVAHTGLLSFTVAPLDGMNFTASVNRSYLRGSYELTGSNTDGISELSELKATDTLYGASLETQHAKNMSSEIRYQFRRYDDVIDDAQDGTVKQVLATLSLKW